MKKNIYTFSRTFLCIATLLVGFTSCTPQNNESTESAIVDEDAALVAKMRDASIPEIKMFIREVLDKALPENYQIPQHIIEAGSPSEATRIVGERYPEFVNQGGSEFLAAIAANPVRYKAMIQESKAIRRHYSNVINNQAE